MIVCKPLAPCKIVSIQKILNKNTQKAIKIKEF